LGGVGEALLPGDVGEEAGDELIGELAEGAVALGLQGGEGGGVAGELLGPERLLGGEVGADVLDGLVRRWDLGSLLGVESHTHGWSFRCGTSLLLSTIATQAANGPFLGTDPMLKYFGLKVGQRAVISKSLPIVGGLIGSTWNYAELRIVGRRAYDYFADRPIEVPPEAAPA
jgi:hypothetical protein